MQILFRVLFIALSLGLVYMLYTSISVPIEFKNTREKRETVVREYLKEIGELQRMYKAIKGDYANSFDTLELVLMRDSFQVDKMIGDPNDTTIQFQKITVMAPAKDSLARFITRSATKASSLEAYFKEIRKVPFSSGKEFTMRADSAKLAAAMGESISAPVFEVSTIYKNYLTEYDSSYMVYDPLYDPMKIRKIGDLSKPSTSGNW